MEEPKSCLSGSSLQRPFLQIDATQGKTQDARRKDSLPLQLRFYFFWAGLARCRCSLNNLEADTVWGEGGGGTCRFGSRRPRARLDPESTTMVHGALKGASLLGSWPGGMPVLGCLAVLAVLAYQRPMMHQYQTLCWAPGS